VKMADTRIILIRHGETEWNRDGRFLGWRESDLTELGRQQAGALALALRNTPLSAIYSSPSQRTVITAQAINVHHGLEIHTDPRLRELNQGQVEGLTASQIRARFPGPGLGCAPRRYGRASDEHSRRRSSHVDHQSHRRPNTWRAPVGYLALHCGPGLAYDHRIRVGKAERAQSQ